MSRRHRVKWGPGPSTKRGRSPQFLSHVYCGQTAAWIKMPLGKEPGLGPSDIELDGDPAPNPLLQKGHSPTIFGPCLLWQNGCMYQGITWYGGKPQPRRHCVRWCPNPPLLTAKSRGVAMEVRGCGPHQRHLLGAANWRKL